MQQSSKDIAKRDKKLYYFLYTSVVELYTQRHRTYISSNRNTVLPSGINYPKKATPIFCYSRMYRNNFDNNCILAVINVKFSYTYKSKEGKPIIIKQLRGHFYENGFNLVGVHYVRYKRSAGSCSIKCTIKNIPLNGILLSLTIKTRFRKRLFTQKSQMRSSLQNKANGNYE